MDHHHIWRGVKIKKVLPDSNNGLVQGFIESIEKSSSIGFKENPEPKYTEEDISIQDATPKFDKNNEKSNKTMKNVEKDEKYEKINHVNEKNEKIDTHRKSRSIFTSNGTFCIGNEFFRSLEEQYKDKLIPFEMFEKELLKHIDFDRVDKVINDLKLAGELFEPRPGFLARLE
jgi:hypothetical protein